MLTQRVTRALLLSSSCLIGAVIGTNAYQGGGAVPNPPAQLALQQLQSDFHGATTLADYELMLSLWAEDAVFFGPSGPIVGPEAIADFFASGPRWGQVASLAPTYKTTFVLDGARAMGQFECILVDTGGASPLTTALSTIPFGSQAAGVEIVQHSTATVTAVKRRGKWLIESFQGGAGPM